MQEEGKLHQLKTRWWKEMHGGGRCDDTTTASAGDSAAELGIDNVGGVFVVLVFGCVCAFIIGILEFLWNVRKVAVDEKVISLCSILFSRASIHELCFLSGNAMGGIESRTEVCS